MSNSITKLLNKKDKLLTAAGSSLLILVLFLTSMYSNLSNYYKIIIFMPALMVPLLPYIFVRREIKKISKKVGKDSIMFRLGQKRVSYLENIIQNSTDIIFTLDSDLRILRFNKGAEFHIGYSQEEILGKPISSIFKDENYIYFLVDETRKTGSVIDKEVQVSSKDNIIKDLNISISEMNYGNTAINGFVITARDVTEKKVLERELKQKNIQLKQLAITDGLTQLFNVRHFTSQLSGEFKRVMRNPDRSLSLIMIDVDNFKDLNDTEGHQTGDTLLKSLAEVIKVCIREEIDSAYRYGGDEFIIILPDTSKEDALVVANRIQSQYSAFKFGMTSLSIGITDIHEEDTTKTLIKRADMAMYKSKKSGKSKATII